MSNVDKESTQLGKEVQSPTDWQPEKRHHPAGERRFWIRISPLMGRTWLTLFFDERLLASDEAFDEAHDQAHPAKPERLIDVN